MSDKPREFLVKPDTIINFDNVVAIQRQATEVSGYDSEKRLIVFTSRESFSLGPCTQADWEQLVRALKAYRAKPPFVMPEFPSKDL